MASYIFLLHRVWCPNLLTVVGYPGPGPVLNTCERLKRTASAASASGVRFGELSELIRSVKGKPIRSGKTKWSTAVGFRKLWGQFSRWRIFSEDKSSYWIIILLDNYWPLAYRIAVTAAIPAQNIPKQRGTLDLCGEVVPGRQTNFGQFRSLSVLERGILMVWHWLECWMFAAVAPKLCHNRMKTWPWPSQLL